MTAATTAPLDAAKALLARGFVVFPADHPDQRNCIGAHQANPCDGKRGKHPAVAFSKWNVVTDKMLEIHWARRGGLANPAVACGPSNVVVLDDDGALDNWAAAYGLSLPDTYTVTTGRGRHLYYGWDHSVQKISNPDFTEFEMDVRGAGGYAIGEGAQHDSGATYLGNGLEVVPLPPEVAAVLIARMNHTQSSAPPIGGAGQAPWEDITDPGGKDPNTTMIGWHKRHKALVNYACRLRGKGMDYAEAEILFKERWLLCVQPIGEVPEAKYHEIPPPECNYPVTWEEAQGKLRDVYGRYAAGEPGGDADPLEGAISHQLTLLRVKREAQRRLDDEQRPRLELPAVKPLAALLEEPDEDTPWLIDKVMQADSRVMLAAQFKSGKTTIVGNVVRSLADGTPFLGAFEVKQHPVKIVLIDDELSERMLRHWLREQGVTNTEAVVDVVSLRGRVGSFNLLDEHVRAQWAQRLGDVGCDCLILDCLRPILDALGLDENRDAGKFLTAFDALLADAGITSAVMVDHMGHSGERNRGDSRKLDWPDATWKLVRENEQPDSARFFSAYGRDVDVFEGRLAFDPATRHLTYVQGSRSDGKVRAAYIDVIRLLSVRAPGRAPVQGDERQWMSKNSIEGALPGYGENTDIGVHTQKAVRGAIALGLKTGVLQVRKGARGAQFVSIAHPCAKCGLPVVTKRERHESCPTEVEGALE